MILLPYRSMKKLESFPYGVIGIAVLNILVYALTTEYFLVVRRDAVDLLAVSHANILTQPWRIVTAMFLHGSIVHILGNLGAFAVFGPAVEGRLRTGKFILFYLLAGIVGGVFEDLVTGFGAPNMPSLGASGAIMGVMGMYLYMFPHSKIKVFFMFNFRARFLQWKASWIIAFYTFFDLWYGFTQASDGVGHLCHLGGMATGWIAMMLSQTPSDTAEQARAEELIQAADGNLASMMMQELAIAYGANPDDGEIAYAYCVRAARDGARRKSIEIMHEREAQLAECTNPYEVAYAILGAGEYDGTPPPWLALRIAMRLTEDDPGLAEALYWRILRTRPRPTGELLEKTLMRLASLLERKDMQKEEASALYMTILQQFPTSDSATIARFKIKELGRSNRITFSLLDGKIVSVDASPVGV